MKSRINLRWFMMVKTSENHFILSVLRQSSVAATHFSQINIHRSQNFWWKRANFRLFSLDRRLPSSSVSSQLPHNVKSISVVCRWQTVTINNMFPNKNSKLFKCTIRSTIDRLFECGYRRYGYWSSLSTLVSKVAGTKPICHMNKNWKKKPCELCTYYNIYFAGAF